MAVSRRHDRLGVHSIGEFHMTVPSLADAERFYGAFGLRVSREGAGLALRVTGSDHVWGRLSEGAKKKFVRLTFHCFEDEFETSIPDEQAEKIKTVGQAIDFIKAHAKS